MSRSGREDLAKAFEAFVLATNSAVQVSYQVVGLLRMPGESKDSAHTFFDILGLVPLFGAGFDATNAMWYAYEGDRLNAGLSVVGFVPVAGVGATGVKLGKDVVKFGGNAVAAGKTAGALADSAKAGEMASKLERYSRTIIKTDAAATPLAKNWATKEPA